MPCFKLKKLEAQWAEPVSLTFHSALRKLKTEPFIGCFPPSFGSLIRQQTWLPQAILVSDWLISKKSSSLKPLCQMNQNLVTLFIEDFQRMLPTKFRFIWPSVFRGEDFLEINQSETRIAYMVCQRHCELLPSLGICRLSSGNFSHFNLLL
jgi:hypothetical protein